MSSSKLTAPRPRGPLALIGPVAAVLIFALLGLGHLQAAAPDVLQDHRKKYALLAGCTEYQNCENIPDLWGPANDIPLYAKLLTDVENGFGFAEADVRVLVGWPEESKDRPTYANIVAAFEDLIAKAGWDTQIFILLAGHGVQVPVPESRDPLDRANPEPDGMDEVFLPADVKSWGPSGLDTALSDNQIGKWLTQMRKQGADVWIVFDCCHSGTMSRGTEQVERPRTVRPEDLGIPGEAIETAFRRARLAAEERPRGESRFEGGALGLRPGPDSKGSLVVFYAAQEWETTPELPRPCDAPRTKDHYYGLLSYTLAKCLQQRRTPMTYQTLGQLLVARYRADRPSRPPTPFFEGDLHGEVLGCNVRSRLEIILERVGGRLRVNAGELSGFGPGSILAVHPPINDQRPPEAILGYVKVVRVTPINSDVKPCGFEGKAMVPADRYPELARCEIVSQVFGDMRVSLVVGDPADPKDPEQVKLTKSVTAALKSVPEEVRPLLKVSSDEATVDWVLRVVTPEQALKKYGIQLNKPRVMLFQGEGLKLDLRGLPSSERSRSVSKMNSRKVFGQYAATDTKRLADEIGRDMSKICTWQNVWRIAGAMSNSRTPGDNYGLALEVVKLKDEFDTLGKPLTATFVEPGDILEYRVKHTGTSPLWVAVVALDPNFGIQVYDGVQAVRGGTTLKFKVEITDESEVEGGRVVTSTGTEGVVVFGVPMHVCPHQPNFDILQQGPMGVFDPVLRGRSRSLNGTETPFETLIHSAAIGKLTGTRGTLRRTPSNPVVLSHSWITLPTGEFD